MIHLAAFLVIICAVIFLSPIWLPPFIVIFGLIATYIWWIIGAVVAAAVIGAVQGVLQANRRH